MLVSLFCDSVISTDLLSSIHVDQSLIDYLLWQQPSYIGRMHIKIKKTAGIGKVLICSIQNVYFRYSTGVCKIYYHSLF